MLRPLLLVLNASLVAAFQGIPGTKSTINGYDSELGTDAICWTSEAAENQEAESFPFPNPLVRDFAVRDRVQLLEACPSGNSLKAFAPAEARLGKRLRTYRWYDYYVEISVDTSTLSDFNYEIIADDNQPIVAVQVVACVLGRAGFCSPFIHEEANARLAEQGILESPARGDRHGGTHVHSPYQFVRLEPDKGPVYKANVTVPMLVNNPASFFTIAAVQLFVGNASTGPVQRYDMANALEEDQRLLNYQDPIVVLSVPLGVRVFSYLAIGASTLALLFLLYQVYLHRKSQILQLSQAYFLIVYLIAAVIASASSWLLLPENDAFCQMSHPIILTNLHLMSSIALGRLWRINSLVSPLLTKGRMPPPKLHVFHGAITRFFSRKQSIRRTMNDRQLLIFILILTLPQVILQILGAVIQPFEHGIDLNEDESRGREYCRTDASAEKSLHLYGFIYFSIIVLSLVMQAYRSRNLPSLLNETRIIFDSTLISVVLLVLGLSIFAVTDSPTTNPAVSYVIQVAIVLTFTCNTSFRFALPKLQMVWRGEQILVSKLLSEHNSGQSKRGSSNKSHYIGKTRVTGLNAPSERQIQMLSEGRTSVSADLIRDMERFDNDAIVDSTKRSSSTENPEITEVEPDTAEKTDSVHLMQSSPSINTHIIVSDSTTPARRLVLKMAALQEQLTKMNQDIYYGRAISKADWEHARMLSRKFSRYFENNVLFEWEGPSVLVGGEIEDDQSIGDEFEE